MLTREREREREILPRSVNFSPNSARNSQLSSNRGKVFAIDSIYEKFTPRTSRANIIFETNIFALLARQSVDAVFMSDVLHHLSGDFEGRLLGAIKGVRSVIIKDIDGAHKFGTFANKMHDLLINGEKVRPVMPQILATFLAKNGYKVEYFYLPKLWYPHFLLVGQRG